MRKVKYKIVKYKIQDRRSLCKLLSDDIKTFLTFFCNLYHKPQMKTCWKITEENVLRFDPTTMTSHLEATFPLIRISSNYLVTTDFSNTQNFILNMVGKMSSSGSENITLRTISFSNNHLMLSSLLFR